MDHIGRCAARVGNIHCVTAAFQTAGEEIGNPFFVFNDQDSHVMSLPRVARNVRSEKRLWKGMSRHSMGLTRFSLASAP